MHTLEPFIPLSLPVDRTLYTTASPSLIWEAGLFLPGDESPELQYDSFRVYAAGRHTTENWNGYPQHPAADVNLAPWFTDGATVPSATRVGDDETVYATPFSDDQVGHFGWGYGALPGATLAGAYEVDQDGVKLAGGPVTTGPYGFLGDFTLKPAASTVRFVLDASRTGASYPLSTKSHTVWTWRSSHEAGVTLPTGWYCSDGTQNCAVEPMMTLDYGVGGIDLSGAAAPGRQTLKVTAGHLQLAPRTKITGAVVQVSFDDGVTWRNATVAGLSGGSYRATYTAPAGSYVTLRVTAADAAGGQISETITRAYKIAR